jgi:signal transduction histidine kinase/predicted CoA-binding protein
MHPVLKRVPLLAELSDEDLTALAEQCECLYFDKGDVLFEEGETGDQAYVIEAGEIEIIKKSSGREVLLAVRKVGEVIGEMSLMEDAPRMASGRARCKVTVLSIPKASLDHLIHHSPSAARGMLYNVLERWRSTGTMLKQSERMAQLGTLTAGVAHELNNPAAAVKRGASQLAEVIADFGAAQRRLGELGLGLDPRLPTLEEAARTAQADDDEDPLDRSDRESDIESWLDEQGIADPWDVAPGLTDLGYTRARLSELLGQRDGPQTEALLRWMVGTRGVHSLLSEVSEGARRISEIVKALKTYSYLDQAPVQAVDLHEGLDSTLLILRSKLKHGIKIQREYADDLPKIQAYGSELNQVWTNLIDNAVDALDGKGTITIRTRRRGDMVEVDIEDDGPGIPEEHQNKIFDAFFTTKPPGKGTGLGLDISYNIVVNRHRGDVRLVSRPGLTRFRVILPVNFDEHDGRSGAIEMIDHLSDAQLLEILQTTKTIAVVGISDNAGAPAHDVPASAKRRGYRIFGVNPTISEALGEKTYPDLKSIPEVPDVVLIFRRSEHVPPIVDAAIEVGAKVVWMQPGIMHPPAGERAKAAGLKVVMDTCWRVTQRRLLPKPEH